MSVFDTEQRTSTVNNATETDFKNYFVNSNYLDRQSRIDAEYNTSIAKGDLSKEKFTQVESANDNLFGEYKKVSDNKKKLQSVRWKLVLFNYIFITLCLFAFCVYNVVVISNLNYNIKLKRTEDNASIHYNMPDYDYKDMLDLPLL